MRIAHHPCYAHPLPVGHRFPMAKYELLPRALLNEGLVLEEHFFTPDAADLEAITAVHELAYVRAVESLSLERKTARRIGFPLSAELIHRERVIAKGTMMGCDHAIAHGAALNIAGGTHHAHRAQGGGFCIYNDQAIGARYVQRAHGIERVLIVDLDVHQGDGTADIFADDPSVFTFSMHGAKNYPFNKRESDLDLPMPDGTRDEAYLAMLQTHLDRVITAFGPQFIFYQSGVDILAEDKLGRLACTMEGCAERDHIVLAAAHDRGLPVQVSMGGGYAADVDLIVSAHVQTYRTAAQLYLGR